MPYIDTSLRDYNVSLNDMITQITTPSSDVYYEKWNKFDGKDIGEAMLKLLASYSHTLDTYRSYNLDSLYLPNKETNALEQIYEMLNYSSNLKRSMVLTVNFVWKGCGPIGSVEIPKFYNMSLTADGVEYNFVVLNQATYLPNASRLYVDIVLGDAIELNVSLDDIIDNKILISSNDVDAESVTFSVDDTTWSRVRNIFYELDGSKKYSVHKESLGTYIYLAPNWQESIPSEISDISIKAAERKDSFDINTQEPIKICLLDDLYCSLGDIVTDQFNVYLMKTKNSADSSVSGKRRIITLEDYETEAKAFPGIVDARAFNWGEGYDLGIISPNMVRLVVLGEDGLVSDFVKNGLKDYITSISLSEIDFDFIAPVIKKVDINLIVNIGDYKGTIFESEVYQNIRTAILNYMSFGNLGIGESFNVGEMLSQVSRSDSRIKYADIYGNYTNSVKLNEIIALGNLKVEFDVKSNYMYDLVSFEDFGGAGPLGTDNLTSDEVLNNLEVYITVGESWFWDTEIPNAEYLEKEFFEDAIFNDISIIKLNYSDSSTFNDLAEASYYSLDNISLENEAVTTLDVGTFSPLIANSVGDNVTNVGLGSNAKSMNIAYNMLSSPDRLYVVYNGSVIAETSAEGVYITGSGNLAFSYSPNLAGPYFIDIYIDSEDELSSWNYTLSEV